MRFGLEIQALDGQLSHRELRAGIGIDDQGQRLLLIVQLPFRAGLRLDVAIAAQSFADVFDARANLIEVHRLAGLEAAGFQEFFALCELAFQLNFAQFVDIAFLHFDRYRDAIDVLRGRYVELRELNAEIAQGFVERADAGVQDLPEPILCKYRADGGSRAAC